MVSWHFDKSLLVLESISGEEQSDDILLHSCPFWMRIYNLPLICLEKESVTSIAQKEGEVLQVYLQEGEG